VNVPFIPLAACGSHWKVQVPAESLTVQVAGDVPGTVVALVRLVHFTSRGKVNQMLKSARSRPNTPIATAQTAAQSGAAPPVTTCGKLPEK